jgi:hypothetical protein
MEDITDIVDAIKIATGLNDVHYEGDSFVLRVNINKLRMVKGLGYSSNSIYLNFEEFKQYPISFLITTENTIHQYWTIRNRLHRQNGKPAYVSIDPRKDSVIRRWYWNGIEHRVDGPAKEMITGFKSTDATGMDGYVKESWDTMHMSWFREGFPVKFPFVRSAILGEGQRIKKKDTGLMQSPRKDLSSFHCHHTELTWSNDGEVDMLRPLCAGFTNLTEWHDEGKVVDRYCNIADVTWKHGNNIYTNDNVIPFNEHFRDTLLNEVDLWNSFYRDEQDEFILITEFDRFKDKL